MRHLRHPSALLAIPALLLTVLGCDSAENPIAPSGSVVTITANPTQISLNGSTTVTVTGFRPDGNPLNPGTQITLSTTLGVLAQTVVEISGGSAATTLRADGRTGIATITASLPGAGEATATVDVQIGQTAETQPTLSITATPNRINIEQNSTIAVIARNADGSRRSAAGVTLRTTLGQLDQENLTTDTNGEASTTLRPDGRSGTADVTGSVESSQDATPVSIMILRTVVSLEAFPSTLNTRETADITVLVRDEDNIALAEGYDVRLTASLGTLAESTVQTGSTGEGSTIYTAADRAGTDTITAFLDNSDSASTSITIRDAPASVTLDVSPVEFTPSTAGTDFTLTVRVANAEGEPLVNELVRFELNPDSVGATFDPPGGPATGGSGTATSTMTITDSGIPDGLTQFTIRALVRDVSSEPRTIRILGGGGGG